MAYAVGFKAEEHMTQEGPYIGFREGVSHNVDDMCYYRDDDCDGGGPAPDRIFRTLSEAVNFANRLYYNSKVYGTLMKKYYKLWNYKLADNAPENVAAQQVRAEIDQVEAPCCAYDPELITVVEVSDNIDLVDHRYDGDKINAEGCLFHNPFCDEDGNLKPEYKKPQVTV